MVKTAIKLRDDQPAINENQYAKVVTAKPKISHNQAADGKSTSVVMNRTAVMNTFTISARACRRKITLASPLPRATISA